MKAFVFFSGATLLLVAAVGWVLSMAFHGPGDAAAIRLSAVVAIVVQVVTFAAVKGVGTRNMVAGWGAGALIRLLTLFVYGLAAVKMLGLPPVAALISIATFFFLTTLIEPLFLKL
jgi:hypothetical protein